MQASAKKTIARIELWHGLSALLLLAILGASELIDPLALFLGALFMGVNFALLGYGVAWLLTPMAQGGRIKAGIALLALKMILFLALLTALFFRFDLDAISFALGFSTLLVAILVETLRNSLKLKLGT